MDAHFLGQLVTRMIGDPALNAGDDGRDSLPRDGIVGGDGLVGVAVEHGAFVDPAVSPAGAAGRASFSPGRGGRLAIRNRC
ncbi:MAG: hypothetical protein B7Z73_07320 [Planctomycetia bacterium 21-64-5]|nr:MAG: hypothetical protein B7Z73_07320 [Planctomycetia bacterium 21-64-5]